MHTFISSHFHSKIQDKSTNFLNNTKFYFKKNIKHYPPALCMVTGFSMRLPDEGVDKVMTRKYEGDIL